MKESSLKPIQDSLAFVGRYWRPVAPWLVGIALGNIVISIISQSSLSDNLVFENVDTFDVQKFSESVAQTYMDFWSLVMMLIDGIFSVLSSCIFFLVYSRLIHNKSLDFAPLFFLALSFTPMLIILWFITTIMAAPLFLLLIIPGVWMTARLVLVFPLYIFNNTGVFGAIGQSLAWTKSAVWQIMLNLVILFFAMMIFSALVNFITGIYTIDGVAAYWQPQSIGINIAETLVTAFYIVWVYRLYYLLQPTEETEEIVEISDTTQ